MGEVKSRPLQIWENSNDRLELAGRELTCGDAVEVLTADIRTGEPKWIKTTVEHNGEEYYLTDVPYFSPIGMIARAIVQV